MVERRRNKWFIFWLNSKIPPSWHTLFPSKECHVYLKEDIIQMLITVIAASYSISCHDDQALSFPTMATAIGTATKLLPPPRRRASTRMSSPRSIKLPLAKLKSPIRRLAKSRRLYSPHPTLPPVPKIRTRRGMVFRLLKVLLKKNYNKNFILGFSV